MSAQQDLSYIVVESSDDPKRHWFHCRHCGDDTPITLPMELSLYVQQLKDYTKQHSECPLPPSPVKDL